MSDVQKLAVAVNVGTQSNDWPCRAARFRGVSRAGSRRMGKARRAVPDEYKPSQVAASTPSPPVGGCVCSAHCPRRYWHGGQLVTAGRVVVAGPIQCHRFRAVGIHAGGHDCAEMRHRGHLRRRSRERDSRRTRGETARSPAFGIVKAAAKMAASPVNADLKVCGRH